jgi:drug/metabolite transporter (DMT)-like permease
VNDLHEASRQSKLKLLAAFACIYVIWGSTYLAIRFAIETIPPLLMASVRFVIAGAVLYCWARIRGAQKPTLTQWRSAGIIGALLLLIGNGGVTLAEQRIPSSIAALIIATVPLWIVLQDWIWHGGARPNRRVVLGLALGLLGVLLLVGPGRVVGESAIDLLGVGILMISTTSWAAGSLFSRKADLPKSPLLATAMEMLAGGVLLLAAGVVTGEPARLNLDALSLRSVLALGYLTVFGSLVAFTAYVWLLRVVAPARIATYAFVNPVIAIVLGWWLAGEAFTLHTLVAASVIIIAVVLIITSQSRARPSTAAKQPKVVRPGTDGCLDEAA